MRKLGSLVGRLVAVAAFGVGAVVGLPAAVALDHGFDGADTPMIASTGDGSTDDFQWQ